MPPRVVPGAFIRVNPCPSVARIFFSPSRSITSRSCRPQTLHPPPYPPGKRSGFSHRKSDPRRALSTRVTGAIVPRDEHLPLKRISGPRRAGDQSVGAPLKMIEKDGTT
jgi:hypothetical protein